eukprot:Pgem_evm1s4200
MDAVLVGGKLFNVMRGSVATLNNKPSSNKKSCDKALNLRRVNENAGLDLNEYSMADRAKLKLKRVKLYMANFFVKNNLPNMCGGVNRRRAVGSCELFTRNKEFPGDITTEQKEKFVDLMTEKVKAIIKEIDPARDIVNSQLNYIVSKAIKDKGHFELREILPDALPNSVLSKYIENLNEKLL